MRQPTLAIVQAPPVFLNLAASVARAASLVREAAADGADIVLFPETWLPGYPVWLDEAPGAALWDHAPAKALFSRLFANAPMFDGPELAALAECAAEAKVAVVMGFHERIGSSLFNSVVYLAADRTRHVHRKLLPTYNERLIWAGADGSTFGTWQTSHGAVGALICWEHWMPLARAAQHAAGEDLHFALWPALGETQLVASRHYAFEGQCFVAAAGCFLTRGDVLEGFDSGPPDSLAREMLEAIPAERDILKAGGSAIIAPDMSYVAGPAGATAELVIGTIDLDQVTAGRLALDTVGHYSRPDIFELHVDRRPRPGVRFTDLPDPD
jgi:predicted amidohydrolase